jgi:acetyl-CoA synthetase/medium-chain acyl-CoA synthetase
MTDRIANLADYQRLRAAFQWERPDYFNFGFDVVDRWADTDPDHVAMRWVGPDSERTVTFAEISARSNQVAAALAQLGLQRGEKVIVILPRVIAWWETLVGLFKAGLVAIPGTTLLTSRDIAYRIQAAEAVAIVTDDAGADKVDQLTSEMPTLKHKIVVSDQSRKGWHSYGPIVASSDPAADPVETPSSDPALIYFTSGTTGMPKMVQHNHAGYGIGHQVTGRFWLDLQQNDLHWNISDTGWAKAAWSSLFGPWSCGTSLFVQHSEGKFQPAEVLKYLAEYPITTMCAAPTIFRVLIQQDLSTFHPRALRHCVAAGEPLNPEVIATWRKATGRTILDGYGQSETVLLCANFPGIKVKPGSMGLPAPGIDLAVIDQEGNRLPPGEEGSIAVGVDPRPVGLFDGYWHDDEATSRAFQQGWYVTGDCAYTDEEGYFWFVGRADDVIASSAYRIGPFEVESALIEHPAVVEAAVVGKADAVRGQIVKAFVVLANGFEPSDELTNELQQHVKQATAPYKYPREIEFVAELPKTTSGKIRRVQLRKDAEGKPTS